MRRLSLINMPCACIHYPSIALTQLRSVVERELAGTVDVEIRYANHDFAEFIGLDTYLRISNSLEATVTGLGDWIFRRQAFPEVSRDHDEYVERILNTLGFDGRVVDRLRELPDLAGAFLDKLIDRYRLDECDFVGFTSMFSQNVASFALARRLKELRPDMITTMGGANCEMSMGRVIAKNVPALDFVFSGPGLVTFPQVLRYAVDGDLTACHHITGVYSRQKLTESPTAGDEVGEELDLAVPVPLDYDSYLASLDERWSSDELTPAPVVLFETSRGCWWGERSHCTFCGLNGATMKYRAMPAPMAIELINGLFERYGSRVAVVESVDNILPREYLRDVMPHIRTQAGTQIWYEVKADLKDHEVEVLAKAGVTMLQPGIEALSSSVLKLIQKGIKSFQNIRFLKSCLRHGAYPAWNLLIGIPGEDESVYQKYIEDLRRLVFLPPPKRIYPIRFDRFSVYHKLADEYGLELEPFPFYKMVYPFDDADLSDLAYFFVDSSPKPEYEAFKRKWIGRVQVQIYAWSKRYFNSDDKLAPRLRVEDRDDSIIVNDSRSGDAIEYEISEQQAQIISALQKPMNVRRLASAVGITEDQAAEELGWLRERDLLFEEDGNALGLPMVDSIVGDEDKSREALMSMMGSKPEASLSLSVLKA